MKKHTIPFPGVIGIDEVGRGPLAGPVTVCACYVLDEKVLKKDIFHNTIRDSKKLKKDLRNNIYITIKQKRMLKTSVLYATSSRSAKHIDKYGIVKSVKACIGSCLSQLEKKGVPVSRTNIRLDAGLTVEQICLSQNSYVKGDERFADIALASIIAKVTRDAYMTRLARVHPDYAWEKNAGYGTKAHRAAITKVGVTPYHRKSYLKSFKLS